MEPAPDAVDEGYEHAAYRGRLDDVSLPRTSMSTWERWSSDRRWQWFGAFDGRTAVGGALVDVGWFGSMFVWTFDRLSREMTSEDFLLPAGVFEVTDDDTHGVVARLDLPGKRFNVHRSGEQVHVTAVSSEQDVRLKFDVSGTEALTAVCPAGSRSRHVDLTEKHAGVGVSGRVVTPEFERVLSGVGGLDYSHGLLPRRTQWRWAMGFDGSEDGGLAFNLTEGYTGGVENAVWVDGVPCSVGRASFEFDGSIRVTSDCGVVDVLLDVEAVRADDIDVCLLESSYRQPLGVWRGELAGREFEGAGVAERHIARW
ncbi:MAG: DUF2804 family protein [Halobacteriales archaeon]